MKSLKITSTADKTVSSLFNKIYGYNPSTIENNGNFYWADQVGFSLVGKFIIKNGLYNGK